jgi:hypothetical protein
MTAETFQYDAHIAITTHAPVQRYSDERDSFVFLFVEGEEFVLRDDRSGETIRLSCKHTANDELTHYWHRFCRKNGVSR